MSVDSKEANIEIYRQRYETFRHLDKLRWQMLQILVAVGSVSALILRINAGKTEWWFMGIIGLIMLVISYVMFSIGVGIRNNNEVLGLVGKKIGDSSIPDVSKKWKASSHWTAILVFFIGFILLANSIKCLFL